MITGLPFSDDLFQRVLIEPALRGNSELYVVSGYSSPAMVVQHFDALRGHIDHLNLDLQIGMACQAGVSRGSIIGYRSLPKQVRNGTVRCRFNTGTPIHSKIYVWCSSEGPSSAFMGSGNYTQRGFGIGSPADDQKEIFVEIDPFGAFDYVIGVSGATVLVDDAEFENLVPVTDGFAFGLSSETDFEPNNASTETHDLVLLPLVQTTKSPGEVHRAGGGLNWGQRGNRNPNEAYIPIPSSVRSAAFFPDKGVRFQLLTDDGDSFVATVAQAGGKAIETPEDNGLIGSYFRRKLGLVPGEFVTTDHLRNFGSNAAKIIKVAENTFQIVFEPGIYYN